MSEPHVCDVAVIGAGAAGLWAAAGIAARGRSVLLIEKTARTGTKVLASGGTRCNLTTTLGAREAARLFGGKREERFLLPGFQQLPPKAVRERFRALGVPTKVEPELEKVFPESGRAVDVRDAMLREALRQGVRVLLERAVTRLEPLGERGADGWRVEAAAPEGASEVYQARSLVLSPGGMSYPLTGTTGDGYAWLRALDLDLVEPVPALVPLRSPEPWVHGLTGIAVWPTTARLTLPSGKVIAQRERPVLFTHKGLSGPGAMDLSAHVARAAAEAARLGQPRPHLEVRIDLQPSVSEEALGQALVAAAGSGTTRLPHALPHKLPKRLHSAVARLARVGDPNLLMNQLGRDARRRLVRHLKGLPVPVEGTLGFAKAEVTAGGLALEEVDRKTMRVKRYQNLYAIGEILDVTGPIGGLNFQAAFATAELAAIALGRVNA
ncbi:MAG: BaiN/RdsA family NAD(P)/FAD-dependent oxidoreductase [Planctomycetota bacterium]|jgi:predicted Rossmann fold flavoprotein